MTVLSHVLSIKFDHGDNNNETDDNDEDGHDNDDHDEDERRRQRLQPDHKNQD